MTSQTIARTAVHKIAALRNLPMTAHVHSSDNDFSPAACVPGRAWDALDANRSARLLNTGTRSWTIEVGDNLWFDLREDLTQPTDAEIAAMQAFLHPGNLTRAEAGDTLTVARALYDPIALTPGPVAVQAAARILSKGYDDYRPASQAEAYLEAERTLHAADLARGIASGDAP